MELPCLYALYEMEKNGIRVDGEALHQYGKKLRTRIEELTAEIHAMAGEEFNINSPKKLGEILFEKLGLKNGKKTKTGYSTSAEVLEKLKNAHPIIPKILEYRQLTKLNSTYAEGLAGYIRADGRIHGKFHQTVTVTGRISSADPNLQNIPTRMPLGREIRKVFIPEEGSVFVDADYSQIELRVLAHMSGDAALIAAYQADEDIHAITASQVFDVPLDQVDSTLRRKAKAVNFGIVYGISSFGLGQDLDISRKEAEGYIEKYFATYGKVKEFLDRTVEDAKKNGYTVTMFGRRRPIPELASSNFMTRSFGERAAMNAPVQGTAADIIKIAMVRVNRRLKKEHLQSKLVLQIHDELIIETKKEEVRKNIKNAFESATKKIRDIISVCPDWEVEGVDVGYKSLIAHLNLKGVGRDMMVIRYQAKVGNFQEESFNTNVASFGSFDLLETNENLKYYTAIGDILNHKDMLSLLKETMLFFANKIAELRKEYDKLDKED